MTLTKMNITFRTRKLEKDFNSGDRLRRAYGERMAKSIQKRMAVLKTAPALTSVPETSPERRHMLQGKRHGQFAVDLDQPYRLVFRPDHDPLPRRDDGGIDVEEVTNIKIVEVVDYH